MRDGVRRVQLPLVAAAAAGVAALPFLRHARNRLISGQPVGFWAAAQMAPPAAAALVAAFLLLLAPSVWPGAARARWVGLAGAGLTVAAGGWLGGAAAAGLAAAGSSAARTSFGPGAWVLLALVLLLASDMARRLALTRWRAVAAVLLAVAPCVLLLRSGAADELALAREYAVQRGALGAALERHALLVLGALGPALALGVPLGVLAQRRPGVRRAVLPVLNLLQTIPSIALFGLLIGPLSALGAAVPWLGVAGVGLAPALVALVLYSLLPIVRNTMAGLAGVPAELLDAARGMGMTARGAFWRIEAPLALPVLVSGVRVTSVQAIGLAAVSALIGAGGLGAIMFQGLFANALDLVILGALPVIGLAVAVDIGLRVLAGRAGGAAA